MSGVTNRSNVMGCYGGGGGVATTTCSGTTDLRELLNSCKSSSPSYTRIADLREECGYPIMAFEKVTTSYGETVMATLEGLAGDDYYLRVYLPRRFNEVLNEKIIAQYNAGMGARLHLVKRSAPAGSSVTPLEFM